MVQILKYENNHISVCQFKTEILTNYPDIYLKKDNVFMSLVISGCAIKLNLQPFLTI